MAQRGRVGGWTTTAAAAEPGSHLRVPAAGPAPSVRTEQEDCAGSGQKAARTSRVGPGGGTRSSVGFRGWKGNAG